MRRFLLRFWNDIKHRKNVELYVLMLMSFVILAADVFGLASEAAIQGILLATLAMLVYGLIDSRHTDEKITNALDILRNSANPSAALKRWDPSEISASFQNARMISLLNVANFSWIGQNHSTLRALLQVGGKIRCILVEPDSDAFRMVLERDPKSSADADALRMNIILSEKLLYQIAKEADNKSGVEVRFIRSLPPLVMTMVDENLDLGVIFASFNGYKVEYNERPSVTLHRIKDSEWFVFYQSTFENYWNNAIKATNC